MKNTLKKYIVFEGKVFGAGHLYILNIWTGHVDEKSNICIMYRCPAPNTFPSKTKYFFNAFFKMPKLRRENSEV